MKHILGTLDVEMGSPLC